MPSRFNPLVALPPTPPSTHPYPPTTYHDLTPHDTTLLTHALSTAPPRNHFPQFWARSFCPSPSICDPRSRTAMLPAHLLQQRRHSSTTTTPPLPPTEENTTNGASSPLCRTHDLLAPELVASLHAFVADEIRAAAAMLASLTAASVSTDTPSPTSPMHPLPRRSRTSSLNCPACVLSRIGDDAAAVVMLRTVMVARMVLGGARVAGVWAAGGDAMSAAASREARFGWVDAWVGNLFREDDVAGVVEGTVERGLWLAALVTGLGGAGAGDVSPLTRTGMGGCDGDGAHGSDNVDGYSRDRKGPGSLGLRDALSRFHWPLRDSPPSFHPDQSLRERRQRRWGAEMRANWYRSEIYGTEDAGTAMFGEDATTVARELGWDFEDSGYGSGGNTPGWGGVRYETM
ncbi:hypothetical protein K490DRAFT_66940 [Saccharata proteae CBS 121410]|uniref:Uncharacterized protein n=1 Tax=Saccharata proteae CBS 121410 TaxID=1314787 RepID=A0A9P4LUC6_9PEZI|nr:hypothetical protein K490DRAFT_66940 [Saccharata proteae CBS 121410]